MSANGSPSSYRQREDKHLQNAVDLEESGSLRDSQESVVSEVQNSSEEVLGKRRQMAKISSVAKLQEVTHSSEMTTTTTSTRVPSDTESINSAKLVAKEVCKYSMWMIKHAVCLCLSVCLFSQSVCFLSLSVCFLSLSANIQH